MTDSTTIYLEIAFRNREARKNAKADGFAWNSDLKLWEKEMRESDIPYYLKGYVVKQKVDRTTTSYSEQILSETYFEN